MIHFAGRCRRRTVLWLMLGLIPVSVAPVVSPVRVAAQARSESLALIVPPAFVVAPSSEASLAIQVAPGATIPQRAIVLIRGLPSTIALSEGRLFESGVWAVGAASLGQLKITSSSASAGRNDLKISLVALDGTLLAEARSALVIGSEPMPTNAVVDVRDNTVLTAATPQRTPDKPVDTPPPAPKRLTAEQTEQLLGMVKKGDQQMGVGNVSAARLLYGRAAESGLAAGALALAATFDDQELKKYRVVGGVQADQKQAEFWYEKARELGSAEARERLQRLGSR